MDRFSQRCSIDLAFLKEFWEIFKQSRIATRINKTSVLRRFIMLSSLNAVISTNERHWIIARRVTFKLHYNQILKSSNWKTPTVKNLRSELSQIQTHHVEAVNELEKTRSLLRVQATINQEQKMEAETLQQRLFQIKAEFQSQIGEYKKLLDMRAARIHKCKWKIVWKNPPTNLRKRNQKTVQKGTCKTHYLNEVPAMLTFLLWTILRVENKFFVNIKFVNTHIELTSDLKK